MFKAITYVTTLTVGLTLGLILSLRNPEAVDKHFAYSIKKELQSTKHIFYVGDIKFTPTKFKNLWLAKVEEEGK